MFEVYRNTSDYISHAVYTSGAPVEVDSGDIAVVVKNPETGEVWDSLTVEDLNLGRYQVRLPFAATRYDGSLKSYWTYSIEGEYITAEEDIEIVTPYVSLDEIVTAYPQLETKTFEELRLMERRVRLIIDKITGQSFGAKLQTVTTTTMTGTFALSDRAYHVHYFTVNGEVGNVADLKLLNDGWLVQVTYTPSSWYNVKSDTYLRRGEPKMSVVLHGSFGRPSVPNDINMAALMLIGDYFCAESIYRQRGVNAMTTADWRIDFNARAFEGTGNLDADMLLNKYAAYNMVII